MKHSPKPWHVHADPELKGKHSYHDHRFITCGNPDVESDEWMHDPNSYIIARMTDCQNQKANAILMSASPEMLEALKAWLKFWDNMPKGQLGNIVCDIGLLNEAFLKTSQAIAKAEGK